jgi:hypothetical protein
MSTETRYGWRISDWLTACGRPFSRQVLYNKINAGLIDARKTGPGGNTVILTHPKTYLESLSKELDPDRGHPHARKTKAA